MRLAEQAGVEEAVGVGARVEQDPDPGDVAGAERGGQRRGVRDVRAARPVQSLMLATRNSSTRWASSALRACASEATSSPHQRLMVRVWGAEKTTLREASTGKC